MSRGALPSFAMCSALAVLAVLAIACGGSNKPAAQPASISNKTGSVDSASQGAGEGRVVQRTNTGGVIELSGDRESAMKQAEEEMAAHCGPNNYTIVQEGEEAIGTDGVRTATAWRVHYQCNRGGIDL